MISFIIETCALLSIPVSCIILIMIAKSLKHKKVGSLYLISLVISLALLIPFTLCKFYGEEVVDSYEVPLYQEYGEYITVANGYNYITLDNNGYLTKTIISSDNIKHTEDNVEPYVQVVTTYKKFWIFEINEVANIAYVPEDENIL